MQGWYEDWEVDGQEELTGEREDRRGRRRVSFDNKVKFRPIPCEGRGRKTPPRGASSRSSSRRGTLTDAAVDSVGESMECTCGGADAGLVVRGDGRGWSDLETDPDCVACASLWGTLSPANKTSVGLTGGIAAGVSYRDAPLSSVVSAHSSGECDLGRCAAHNRLSDGHLEAGRSVATLRTARASRRSVHGKAQATVLGASTPRCGIAAGGALVVAPSHCTCTDKETIRRAIRLRRNIFPSGLK